MLTAISVQSRRLIHEIPMFSCFPEVAREYLETKKERRLRRGDSRLFDFQNSNLLKKLKIQIGIQSSIFLRLDF